MPLLELSTLGLGRERERGREYSDCGEGWGQLNPSPCKGLSMEKRDATPRRRKGGKEPKQSIFLILLIRLVTRPLMITGEISSFSSLYSL